MASDALQRLKWGLPPRIEPGLGLQSVATTATRVALANPNRLTLRLVNKGANNVHVGHDPKVTTGTGDFLAANGGSAVYSYDEDGEEVFGEFWCIAETGAVNVFVAGAEESAPPRAVAP